VAVKSQHFLGPAIKFFQSFFLNFVNASFSCSSFVSDHGRGDSVTLTKLHNNQTYV